VTSIRLRLLKWLIGPILLVNLSGAALTYLLAWVPAQLAFDQGLADATGALAARLRGGAAGVRVDLPPAAEQVLRANDVDALYFCVRGAGRRLLAGDAALQDERGDGGAYDGIINGEPARIVFRSVLVDGETVRIGVAKTTRKRAQMRAATLRILLLIEGLFTLGLVGLIWFSVTTGLLPLARMRADLARREAGDLAPIDGGLVPYELVPVVGAINELLDKVRAGATTQHQFLADVAHQLRTPLAGFKLQLEWLAARHCGDLDSAGSLRLMAATNERMIRQTNQLLALARAEPSHFEKKRLERVDLAALVAEVVQYFVECAAGKHIDLGFDLQTTLVGGDSFLLRDLIDNLIDNAVRYTPRGGTVTVRCTVREGNGVFEVEDSGPGIAPELRAQAFQRFVRFEADSAGSGLGLAIVRDIAQAHRARVVLADAASGQGLRVAVIFAPIGAGI
jgi:two-component system sensor histidine kinase TctE